MSYDNWKLATPYDSEPSSADLQAIAEFYETTVDELTSNQISNYADDQREQEGER